MRISSVNICQELGDITVSQVLSHPLCSHYIAPMRLPVLSNYKSFYPIQCRVQIAFSINSWILKRRLLLDSKMCSWNVGHLWHLEKCILKHFSKYSLVIHWYSNFTKHYDESLQVLEILKWDSLILLWYFQGIRTFEFYKVN